MPETNKKNTSILPVLIIALVVLAAAVVWGIFLKKPSPSQPIAHDHSLHMHHDDLQEIGSSGKPHTSAYHIHQTNKAHTGQQFYLQAGAGKKEEDYIHGQRNGLDRLISFFVRLWKHIHKGHAQAEVGKD